MRSLGNAGQLRRLSDQLEIEACVVRVMRLLSRRFDYCYVASAIDVCWLLWLRIPTSSGSFVHAVYYS